MPASTQDSLTQLDGRRGWTVTAAAALSMFVVFGTGYSFGAFFDEMAEEFGASSSSTALIFSITISLSFLAGSVTGRIADRVGPRPVLLVGAGSLLAGLLLTSRVGSLWLGYLTYGAGVGIAIACGYVPAVAAVGGWFEKRRATALGVAVAGIGLGTLVGSPVAAALIKATSWRTTYTIFGIVGAALLVLAALIVERGPAAAAAAKPLPISELLQNSTFRVLYGSSVCITFGLFVPFVFLNSYATERGTGSVAAAILVGLIGGSSIVGRIGLATLADRLDLRRLYQGSIATMAASHIVWLLAGSRYPMLAVYAIVLGFGYGGFIALSPAVTAERFGLDTLGGVLGTLYTSAAIGSLAGPPIAGVITDEWGAEPAIAFALGLSLVGTAIIFRLE